MTVFNKTKTVEQYEDKALFLGEDKGLLNTIHKHFPKIWKYYKVIKSLDWSEDEFTFSRCINEFKTCAPDVRDMMIKTLAWQWEADSIAATSPIYLVAPFNPCIEVWEAEVAITANEMVHANTYSEIVRMSFENPPEVLGSILADQEAMDRVSVIEAYLSEFAAFSLDYKQNPEKYTRKEAIKNLMKFYYAMLLLERIQFMASFAITFTICKSGL
jgi:ribonucleoside-diphosphate reductase beta chain